MNMKAVKYDSGNGKRIATGNRQRNLLSETVRIEEELVPGFVRPLLVLAAVMVFSFLIWAGMTNLTEVASAPGEIIPTARVKVVQNLDGGVVAAINVQERQLVKQGQVLVRMDGSQANSELQQMEARLASLNLRSERLSAFAEGRTPDFSSYAQKYPGLVADQEKLFRDQEASRESTLAILDDQIRQQQRSLKELSKSLSTARRDRSLTKELVDMRKGLAAKRLIKRAVMVETERAAVTAEGEVERLQEEIQLSSQKLSEAKNRRADTENQLRKDAVSEMGTVSAEMAEANAKLVQLRSSVDRLKVRAPVDGYVFNLKVDTVGQVVQPGAVLMQIVPDARSLEAQVRIDPRDIGYVKVGQPVKLQVSGYDYSRFGYAKGKIKRISASSVVDPNGNAHFLGWVELTKPYLGNDPKRYQLQPGMSVGADILTGKKTLLAYLTKPLTDVFDQSFQER